MMIRQYIFHMIGISRIYTIQMIQYNTIKMIVLSIFIYKLSYKNKLHINKESL